MTAISALSSELAQRYGKVFVANVKSVEYDQKSRELRLKFNDTESSGEMTRARGVAHSFEDFVETLFCKCGFKDATGSLISSKVELFSQKGNVPIATVFQYENDVYIRPRISSLGCVPIEAILPAYKKAILRNA